MSTSSDAAEQVVKMSLEGTEIALKVTGQATKHIVATLYAISQDKNRTKGKIRLSNMIRTGKELKIFSVQKYDLRTFAREAKRYGVLYCALVSKLKSSPDGMVDIMVRAEDAPKVNRIVERFNLITGNSAEVKEIVEKERGDGIADELIEEKNEEDLLVDDILSKPEPVQELYNDSPSSSHTAKKSQLENNLKKKQNTIKNNEINQEQKPSVREELKNLEKKVEAEEKLKLKKERDTIDEIIVSSNVVEPKENELKKDENTKHQKLLEPKHIKQNKRKNYKHLKKAKHMKTNERNK